MNSKDLKKIKTQTVEQLTKELSKKKLEIMVETVNLSVGKSASPNKKRELKRDISQISTIIREKELQAMLIIREKELQDETEQRANNKEQDVKETKKKGTKTAKNK